MAKLEARYRNAADKAAGRISGYAGVWYDPTRRPSRKYVTLRTKDETTARQRLTELERKEALGVWHPWDDPAPEKGVTVDKAVKRYLKHQREKGRAPATVKTAKITLERFARGLPAGALIQHVEGRHVAAFLAKKKKNGGERSAAAKARYYAVLLHFSRWAKKRGLTPAAFAEGVDVPAARPNRREHITEAEEAAMLRAIAAAEVLDGRSQRWLTDWLQFATRTGLRPGEQQQLRWSAVRLAEGVIRVGKGHRVKTRESVRTVPVPGVALDILRRLADERTGEGDGYVFRSAWGGEVDIKHLTDRLRVYAEAAGLGKRVTAYSCRHAYGTRLALAGTPLFIIAKLMGTSVAMVERHYAAYSPEAGAAYVAQAFAAAREALASAA